jgi:hypothetical protein
MVISIAFQLCFKICHPQDIKKNQEGPELNGTQASACVHVNFLGENHEEKCTNCIRP